MPKPEIKVPKADVFDPKLEAAVKKAAQDGGESEATESFDEAYVIRLLPTLKYDEKKHDIVATCAWKIFEGGGSKLFERLKQTKGSEGRATANRDKVTPANLKDTVGAVCANEVRGITKALKSLK